MPDKKKHYRMNLETGFYGARLFRLPKGMSDKAKKLTRHFFNRVGMGHLIIRGKPGRPKKKK
jgi:hypothetical protein